MIPVPEITPDYIREILDYNPDTGIFTWKTRRIRPGRSNDANWNSRFAGQPVALRQHRHGHYQIVIHCRNYMYHRVAWMHYYGVDPGSHLDHVNGDPTDNRIANLRLATPSQNMMNQKRRTDNTSGVKGVSWSKKERKWYAYITVGKKMKGIGRFHNFDQAVDARRAAQAEMHGEFGRSE